MTRARRKQKGLTQDQLAELIGRTAESVSNIERARSIPSVETVLALAKALDTPVREFFPEGDDDQPVSVSRRRKEAEAAALLRSLSENVLDVALDQLRAIARIGRKAT